MGKAIGIDLGTTYSVAAILKKEIQIIRNTMEDDSELTRSCVASLHGVIEVGNQAYNYSRQIPENVIVSVKRLMGNSIDSDYVQKMKSDRKQYRFGIVEKSKGTRDTLAVLLEGKEYLPEEISAEILKKIKKYAEEFLNDEVTHAVITVPAYFSEKQKYATLVAAKLAGLKVQKLLPEPTAAAIAYGVDSEKNNLASTILVYDFGGGTFDISILAIADGQYLEIAKGGDMWLGGDDIDNLLMEYIKRKTEAEYNLNSIDKLISSMEIKKRVKAEFEFKKRVEELKIKLSSVEKTTFELNDLILDVDGNYIDIEYLVTREEFEKIIEPIVDRTLALTLDLIKNINYEIQLIDKVLLVGGSSKISLVKNKTKELFGDKVMYSQYPMLEIAKGAAIVSQRLGSEDITSDISVDEIKTKFNFDEISHSISHDVFIKIGEDGNIQEKLAFKSTEPYPAEKHFQLKTLYPNQKIAKIEIIQKIPNDKDHSSTCFITLQKEYPADKVIYLTLFLDENETITLKAQVEGESTFSNFKLGRGGAFQKTGETIDRSGLTARHEAPRSSLLNTRFAQKNRRAGLCGLISSGESQFQR